MPYHVQWLLKYRIIYVALYNETPYGEVKAVFEQIIGMMTDAPNDDPIHVIGDPRNLQVGLSDTREILRVTRPFFAHPRLGFTLMVSSNPMYRFLTGVVSVMAGANYKVYPSLDLLKQHILAHDRSITDEAWLPIENSFDMDGQVH